MLESLRSIKDLMCVWFSMAVTVESFMETTRYIYLTLLLGGSNRNNYNEITIVKLTFLFKAV